MKGKPMFDLNKPTPDTKTTPITLESSFSKTHDGGEITMDDSHAKWFQYMVEEADQKGRAGEPTEYRLVMTPDWAKHFLTKNSRNRPISRITVIEYKNKMKRGKWIYMPEAPYAVDWDGFVRQGGHRCAASSELDMTVRARVLFGCNPANYEFYDEGKRRTGNDVLSQRGMKWGTELTSLTRTVQGYWRDNATLSIPKGEFDNQDVGNFAAANQEELLNSLKFYNKAKSEKLIRPPMFAAAHYLITSTLEDLEDWKEDYPDDEVDQIIQHKREAIDKWFDTLISNQMLNKGDSAYHLRKRMYQDALTSTVVRREAVLTYIIKGWNSFATGKCLKAYHYVHEASLPRVSPPKYWSNV